MSFSTEVESSQVSNECFTRDVSVDEAEPFGSAMSLLHHTVKASQLSCGCRRSEHTFMIVTLQRLRRGSMHLDCFQFRFSCANHNLPALKSAGQGRG